MRVVEASILPLLLYDISIFRLYFGNRSDSVVFLVVRLFKSLFKDAKMKIMKKRKYRIKVDQEYTKHQIFLCACKKILKISKG